MKRFWFISYHHQTGVGNNFVVNSIVHINMDKFKSDTEKNYGFSNVVVINFKEVTEHEAREMFPTEFDDRLEAYLLTEDCVNISEGEFFVKIYKENDMWRFKVARGDGKSYEQLGYYSYGEASKDARIQLKQLNSKETGILANFFK